MVLLLPVLLVFSACEPAPGPADSGSWAAPRCGDGVLDPGEACDEGGANSDLLPDACRSTCLLPACGDGVADAGEACDDGGPLGGDGCTPSCTLEDGLLEVEPNDGWDQAQDLSGAVVFGALPAGDLDCFGLDLEACGALGARLLGPCPQPAVLRLHDPSGAAVAVGSPGSDGCAVLDPAEAPGARFVAPGRWAVCVEGLLGAPVDAWGLELSPVAPQDARFTVDPADDPDGDGRPDGCDDDRDGDGVLDVDDVCPEVPDGAGSGTFSPSSTGFFRSWLALAPLTGTTSPDTCLPGAEDLVGLLDDGFAPEVGDLAAGQTWTALWSDSDRVGLEAYASVHPPREAYLAVYLYSEAPRHLTLALGPDDGARAWLSGQEVLSVSSCQGTNVDQFQVELDLVAGWQPLVLRVYDQGGGWGTYLRFLDGGVAVTDLVLSLDPSGQPFDQRDSDGDGIGDACDDTPMGLRGPDAPGP